MLSKIKERLWLPENIKKYRNVLIVLAVLWMTGCVLLVVPQVRSAIISTGEKYILNRSVDQAKWQETFLLSGLTGIIAPLLFFFGLVLFAHNYSFFKDAKKAKIISGIFIGLTSLWVIWLIMYKAEWILGDDHQFLVTTAVNQYFPFLVSHTGRFWPLGLSHYNILVVFSRLLAWKEISASAHFAVNVIIYSISVVFLYFLFRDIEPQENKKQPYINTFFVCFLPLFSVAFIMVYMQCVFPETILTLLLAVFMFCYYRALKTNKTKYYITALLAAVYSTYCKEPVFGLFVIIAFTNLLFGHKQQTKRTLFFNIGLLVNAVLFMTLYYNLSYRNTSEFYNTGRVEQNSIQSITLIFIHTKFLFFIVFLFIWRFFSVVVKKDRDHLYYDGLLFAGIGYIAAYIFLHLQHRYYFFPAVILSLPSFVYWSKYLFLKKNKFYAAMFLLPVIMICSFNLGEEITLAKETITQRKTTMAYIHNLIRDYEAGKSLLWYEEDSQDGEISSLNIRDNRKGELTIFINYVKKTDTDYFITVKPMEYKKYADKNDVFLYSKANNHYRPMAGALLELLRDRGYVLETDSFEIYKYRKP
jgi:hypothetical protein